MHTWIDTAVEPSPLGVAPPVDDLLRVYLGQPRGTDTCDPHSASSTSDAHDIWDRLGDFA